MAPFCLAHPRPSSVCRPSCLGVGHWFAFSLFCCPASESHIIGSYFLNFRCFFEDFWRHLNFTTTQSTMLVWGKAQGLARCGRRVCGPPPLMHVSFGWLVSDPWFWLGDAPLPSLQLPSLQRRRRDRGAAFVCSDKSHVLSGCVFESTGCISSPMRELPGESVAQGASTGACRKTSSWMLTLTVSCRRQWLTTSASIATCIILLPRI